jgi:carbon-monoxide dehydrogenase medium subunit
MGTIGGNVCHAEPAADFPPALIALGAEAEVVGLGGARREAVHDLFADYYELSLSPEEIVVAFHVPVRDGNVGSAFLEITKNHNSIAAVNVATVVELDAAGVCTYAGLGVGGVAATPLRIAAAAELVGSRIGDRDIGRVAEDAMSKADPISNAHASAAYRRKMVGVLVERALRMASAKAEENRGRG